MLTWGQSSGENQLTGYEIAAIQPARGTETYDEKSRRCYAARRQTSQRICVRIRSRELRLRRLVMGDRSCGFARKWFFEKRDFIV